MMEFISDNNKIDLKWLGTKPIYYGIDGKYLGKKPPQEEISNYKENVIKGKYVTSGMG